MVFKNDRYENIKYEDEIVIKQIIEKIFIFISNYGIPEEELIQLYKDMKEIQIEFASAGMYSTRYCDQIRSYKFSSCAAAFFTILDQQKNNDGFVVTPGIVLRNDRIFSNIHTFVHEFLHAVSAKRILKYDNQKNTVTKIGFNIMKWDKDDNLIEDKRISALNEGITEMLTQQILGENGKNMYLFQVIIAKLLSKYDDEIIKTYFSRDENKVDEFLERFNKMQNVMTSEEFSGISQFNIEDSQVIYTVLKACIQYCISISNIKGETVDKDEIIDLVSKLDKSVDYGVSEFKYADMCFDIICELNQNIHK